MKKNLKYYVFSSVLIGTYIYLCQKLGIVLPDFVQFYVNDFLIIPIVLFLCLVIIRKLQDNKELILSITQIGYVCVLYAVIFEYWLPKFHPRYTQDLVDVLLYFSSGVVFYFLQKKS